jgi:hypothetical protein
MKRSDSFLLTCLIAKSTSCDGMGFWRSALPPDSRMLDDGLVEAIYDFAHSPRSIEDPDIVEIRLEGALAASDVDDRFSNVSGGR